MAGSKFPILRKTVTVTTIPDRTIEDINEERAQKKAKADSDRGLFLSDMAAIESSSGNNTNHKMMDTGMHTGQKAVGSFGLMPKTVKDMAKRMDKTGEIPGVLRALVNSDLPEQEVADIVAADPELEMSVAEKLYNHIATNLKDPEHQNLAWEYGHNLKPGSEILEQKELNPRTQKFRALRRKIASK